MKKDTKNQSLQLPEKVPSFEQAQPKTLDDLIDQAQEVWLPKVDTTDWQTYRDEKLGIEFMYPKGWSISHKGNTFFCIVKGRYTDKSVCSLEFESLQGEMAESVEEYLVSMYINVDKEHASFGKLFNDNLPQKAFFVVKEGGRDRFSVKNNDFLMTLYVYTEDNEGKSTGDVIETSYGILQTLKPIQK